MRRLPIGIQDFATIREEGFYYVDKTARVHQLATGSGRAFFLSRPRRFGKSLLCSTLEALFEGRRELFGEIAGYPALAIDSLDWEWKRHPVIKLDLNPGDYQRDGVAVLNSQLDDTLGNTARRYGLELRGEFTSNRFANLVFDLRERTGEKAAVIIDEYDKPLLSTMDNPAIHDQLKSALKGVYGVLKSSDAHLRFVFLTGVTKFAHVSVFSDLNQLVDLSLDPRYADLCGITQEEVEACFEPEIQVALDAGNVGREEYIEDLRKYYNGYRFSKKPLKVYNPFGLLKHFDQCGQFETYWYNTGTPAFLIKLLADQKINILDLNNMRVGLDEFGKYDVATMKAAAVLYQSGYLTIADYEGEQEEFVLDYPNIEVRAAFARSLIEQYLQAPDVASNSLFVKLPKALRNGCIEEAMDSLRQFLAAVPYDIIKESENYYETALHIIFSMFGLSCRSEVRIAAGRIDTLVETKNFVYCFEFKLDGSAEEALAQIDTKEYLLPWEGSGKKLFKIGVSFDSGKRNIGEWKHT